MSYSFALQTLKDVVREQELLLQVFDSLLLHFQMPHKLVLLLLLLLEVADACHVRVPSLRPHTQFVDLHPHLAVQLYNLVQLWFQVRDPVLKVCVGSMRWDHLGKVFLLNHVFREYKWYLVPKKKQTKTRAKQTTHYDKKDTATAATPIRITIPNPKVRRHGSGPATS